MTLHIFNSYNYSSVIAKIPLSNNLKCKKQSLTLRNSKCLGVNTWIASDPSWNIPKTSLVLASRTIHLPLVMPITITSPSDEKQAVWAWSWKGTKVKLIKNIVKLSCFTTKESMNVGCSTWVILKIAWIMILSLGSFFYYSNTAPVKKKHSCGYVLNVASVKHSHGSLRN